jgi:hypothetical protein
MYVFFLLMLFFLLVELRFFPVPVFLLDAAFAFCDGFGFGLGLGFAGLLVGISWKGFEYALRQSNATL